MKLKVGQSLASATDATAVIVIRAPGGEVSLTCGGQEMVDPKSDAAIAAKAAGPGAGGLQLGKRYVDDDETVELLCTKPGSSALEYNGKGLSLKEAKALPSSD
jgi:hypothetical protein